MAPIEKNGRAAWLKRKRREEREESAETMRVRAELMEIAAEICMCCGIRRAQSMHEEPPRSKGTKPSLETSMVVCGSGTTGCHGLIQSDRIIATFVGPFFVGNLAHGEKRFFAPRFGIGWTFIPVHARALAHLRGEEVAN